MDMGPRRTFSTGATGEPEHARNARIYSQWSYPRLAGYKEVIYALSDSFVPKSQHYFVRRELMNFKMESSDLQA